MLFRSGRDHVELVKVRVFPISYDFELTYYFDWSREKPGNIYLYTKNLKNSNDALRIQKIELFPIIYDYSLQIEDPYVLNMAF